MYQEFENRSDVVFLVVVEREPHAGQMAFKKIAQPQTIDARRELARRLKSEFELPMNVYVDSMTNESRAVLGDLPSPAFVINRGTIVAKFPWAEPTLIAEELHKLTVKP